MFFNSKELLRVPVVVEIWCNEVDFVECSVDFVGVVHNGWKVVWDCCVQTVVYYNLVDGDECNCFVDADNPDWERFEVLVVYLFGWYDC